MAESTPTRKPSANQHRRGVKKRKYTNEERQNIMKMIKEGAKTHVITSALNIPESTVRTMRKQLATFFPQTRQAAAVPIDDLEEDVDDELIDAPVPVIDSSDSERDVLDIPSNFDGF